MTSGEPLKLPAAAALLDVWDRGERASNAERALLLLGTFRTESSEELRAMPLGWVNANLLRLREGLIGPVLECLCDCRRCGARVECEVPVAVLTASGPSEAAERRSLRAERADYRVEFRRPTCADLLALDGDPPSAARQLAERLIERASRAGAAIEPREVPPEVCAAIESAVLVGDPLVQIELGLECPGCGLGWSETLDVVDFVWRELAVLAERLLLAVARLAHAFGWREADILALSEQRRQRYLELLAS